ncbi:hypothetical protein GCM10022393_05260 [Aquimarina addita]|uniref:Uncharacterized protein n=1 Tax=Aquimarina addita TaxID=870485 RepID=A0ABP7XA42_9FLAO
MIKQQRKGFTYILPLLILCTQFNFAQEYKKYIPYQHENLWGIIDSTQQVIIKSQYKDINVIGKLDYVQFDNKTLIDMSTGQEIPNAGNHTTTVTIENQLYHLFNTDEKSVLINLEKKDTITLSLQYQYMSNLVVTDKKSDQQHQYILGKLGFEEYVLLKNTKKLPLAISAKSVALDVLEDNNNTNIAIVIKKGSKSMVYGSNVQLKKTFTHDGSSDLLTNEQLKNLASSWGEEGLRLTCISCEEIYDDSWYINDESQLPKAIKLKTNSDYTVFLKTDATTTIEGNARTLAVDYSVLDIKTISAKGITIIVDDRYVRPQKLMFPKGILLED